jgi:hypothetical protein
MTDPEHYTVQPLTLNEARQAFPLLQSLAPETSLGAWLRFTRDMDPADGDAAECRIMVLRSCAGWLFGMFTYLSLPHLLHGRVLEVDNVALLDLGNRRTLSQILLEEVDGIARGCGCGGIHYHLTPGLDHLVDGMRPAAVRDAAGCGGRLRNGHWVCRPL